MKLKTLTLMSATVALFAQNVATISPSPYLQFLDPTSGKPLSGASLCVYQAGTSTPVSLWHDAGMTSAWNNPIVLDSTGRALAYIPAGALKYVLRAKANPPSCSSGNIIFTTDNIQDSGTKLRTDITGPNGLAMIPFAQPATPAAPNPMSGPVPSNMKMAQTVNVQDFELPDASKSCSGSTHDDVPAITAAISYVRLNGRGTVTFPHRTCWLNSKCCGTTAINLAFASNMTLDLTGAVFNTTAAGTVAFGTSTANSLTPPTGWMSQYIALFAAAHDQWASPSNDLPKGANHVILATPANAANYHAGDAIYIQSGTVIGTTPFNSETLIARSDGNPTTGEVDFRDPTIHAYTNDGMNAYGLVNVEAHTIHNLHILNQTSAPSAPMLVWALTQCVDCTAEGGNWDAVNGEPIVGNLLNLRLVNLTWHIVFTTPHGDGFFQNDSGMTRTHFVNPHFSCTTTSGISNFVSFTEGSGATEIIGGELSSNGCGLFGGDFDGVKIQGVRITGNTVMNFGAASRYGGFGLLFQNNDVLDTSTVSNPVFLMGNTQGIVSGNRFNASVTGGSAAIAWVGNCNGCVFSGNEVNGGGVFLQSNDNHAFSVIGNVIRGPGSGVCIQVVDNGVQTQPMTVANNYCGGFASDLVVGNFANEGAQSVFAPNAFNDTPAYTPVAAGFLKLSAFQATSGVGLFRVAAAGGPGVACAPDTPIGDAYGGSFVAHTAGTCGVNINPGSSAAPIAGAHGWLGCTIFDSTTPANTASWFITGMNSTTVAFQGTTAPGDVMVWSCSRPY